MAHTPCTARYASRCPERMMSYQFAACRPPSAKPEAGDTNTTGPVPFSSRPREARYLRCAEQEGRKCVRGSV